MATVERIETEHAATQLAALLNGNTRRRPVAVVTTPSARAEPWIDVEEIAREAGPLADVYLMPTGPQSWAFSRQMADGTQVYGGAGRVYPVGHEWASDLAKSPLRFAFNADDGARATAQLVSDLLRMASASGLVRPAPAREQRPVTGKVKGIVSSRGMVDVGRAFPATIAEELTVEGVPIERIVSIGQRVSGLFDADTNRLDVTASLRPGTDALADYRVGDVVLTRVAMVRNGKAELVLYPKTTSPAISAFVLRADVTPNELDDLRTLMTVGEVIPARVVATGPAWSLVLHDVDDDEPILPAPSLLPGGPPWLVEEAESAAEDDHGRAPAVLPMPAPVPPAAADQPEAAAPPAATLPTPLAPTAPRPRPTPALFDRSRPKPSETSTSSPAPAPAPAPAPPPPAAPTPSPGPMPVPAAAPEATASTRSLLSKIDGLAAQVRALEARVGELNAQVLAGEDERAQLRYLLDQAERRANSAETDLKNAKSRLRKASSKTKAGPAVGPSPRFADPEQGFRYLVLTSWATRTLPGEQTERPLPEYALGPDFLGTLENLEGISTEKVADVVFEIVTGLAPQIASRQVHQLRTGTGGDDPYRVRADGAIAWRASLQVESPGARRIHYWQRPDGTFELARVAHHDDFDI